MSHDHEGAHIQNNMVDGVDDVLLWGDYFKVILDILETDETDQQQFVAVQVLLIPDSDFLLPTQTFRCLHV